MMKKPHLQVALMLFCRSNRRYAICLFICVWMMLGAGCRFPWPMQPRTVDPSLSPTALKAYRAAVAKFQDGAYDDSAERFSAIRDQTADKRMARMALYGLALSRLVAAATPEAHEQALLLWQNWVDIAPDVAEIENAALFDTLVKEKMLFSNIPAAPEKTDQTVDDGAIPNWLFIRTKQEMDRLRRQLLSSKETIIKRESKIESLHKEIGRLKRQIKAMEAIDQKIQEKKNAIPSAD